MVMSVVYHINDNHISQVITIEFSVRAFSTGMPAIALLGSSSASLFTCSVGGGKEGRKEGRK